MRIGVHPTPLMMLAEEILGPVGAARS